MSALQAIELANEWVQPADENRKLLTVRKGKRDYQLGRLMLVSPSQQWCKEVECTNVSHIELGKIPEDTAIADGFSSTSDLKSKLTEYYGPVPDSEIMTVVHWQAQPSQ